MSNFAGSATTNYGGSGGGTGNWLATIYSQKALKFFRTASVVEGITNNDYLGEISAYGDTVKVIKEPTITVSSYTRGATVAAQALVDNELTLTIDQANYFSFNVDDLEEKLSHVNWKELATSGGAYGLKNKFDQEVLDYMATQALAANQVNNKTTANILTVGFASGQQDPLNLLSKMARLLDEQEVPEEGRWLVVSPRFLETLVQSSSKLISTDYNDGAASLKNGLVMAAPLRGFRIHKTNNAPVYTSTGGTPVVGADILMAGHMSAVATASAITNTETFRNQTTFGDVVRGLHVYARSVVRPESLCVAHITYPA
jgi:hypothetical protein|tara:strand:+ start:2414 stop:3358 length:945 start_codon:yes stop_codon:yes gene_type:complete